jgi:2-phosphosulfolactate phosphatase
MTDTQTPKFPIEVCLTPALWHLYDASDSVVILTDIFRATTSMVAAFDNKVKSIIPVAEIAESLAYKEKGYIVAGEREGKKLDFAHFGNSPFNFMEPSLTGKTIVLNTTNGTQALNMVKGKNNLVAIGAFLNLVAVCNWAMAQNRPIIIFCAGWKGRFSLEDSLFAGAAAEYVLRMGKEKFFTNCDSSIACIDLWHTAKADPRAYIEKASHRHRLEKMGLDDVIDYCLQLNISSCIPVLKKEGIVNIAIRS